MCTAMKEAPPATLATFLNELWCHRTKVLSRRLRARVEIDAEARRLSPSFYLPVSFVLMAS